MPRSRRLPTVNVSLNETHHAYTSPPIPEKGGLPTIIVTPAEASTISDFEIHFYSPKPSQTAFLPSTPQGFFPRMRLFFRRPAPMPSPQALMEKADYFDDDDEEEEEDIAEARHSRIVTAIPRITVTSPARHGEYVALAQDEEEVEPTTIPGVPTISEEQWTAIRSSSPATGPISFSTSTTLAETHNHNHRLLTRKVRALLFLSVPVALVAFHLITHQMGLFPGSGDSAFDDARKMWSDESGAVPLAGLGL